MIAISPTWTSIGWRQVAMTSSGGHAHAEGVAGSTSGGNCLQLVTETFNANMLVSMTDYRPTISKKTWVMSEWRYRRSFRFSVCMHSSLYYVLSCKKRSCIGWARRISSSIASQHSKFNKESFLFHFITLTFKKHIIWMCFLSGNIRSSLDQTDRKVMPFVSAAEWHWCCQE